MRSVLLLVLPAMMLAACKKSATVTAPVVLDAFSSAGVWGGCIPESANTCVPISMTLADSSLTDSTAKVTGSGNWGETVSISGSLIDANINLVAAAPGLIQQWRFVGALSGASLVGTMTIPEGAASGYAVTFTRAP